MNRGVPNILQDVECVVYDFNTGAEIGEGRCDIIFTEDPGRLRVKRTLFTGQFRPNDKLIAGTLRASLISAASSGAPQHTVMLDHEERTWAFRVKFELGDGEFDFTGRAEPTLV